MDIIKFTKKVRYPDFQHDIIEFFSENAALHTIIKSNASNISVDAVVEAGFISYTLEFEDTNLVDIELLETSLNRPITIFGETHYPVTVRTENGLVVNFGTTAE